MGYEVWNFKCSNRKHGEMEYRGDGDYVCPVCGETYHDDEFDDVDNESESISVYDAALIWASHGKDEDYTFGYSDDELESAL